MPRGRPISDSRRRGSPGSKDRMTTSWNFPCNPATAGGASTRRCACLRWLRGSSVELRQSAPRQLKRWQLAPRSLLRGLVPGAPPRTFPPRSPSCWRLCAPGGWMTAHLRLASTVICGRGMSCGGRWRQEIKKEQSLSTRARMAAIRGRTWRRCGCSAHRTSTALRGRTGRRALECAGGQRERRALTCTNSICCGSMRRCSVAGMWVRQSRERGVSCAERERKAGQTCADQRPTVSGLAAERERKAGRTCAGQRPTVRCDSGAGSEHAAQKATEYSLNSDKNGHIFPFLCTRVLFSVFVIHS